MLTTYLFTFLLVSPLRLYPVRPAGLLPREGTGLRRPWQGVGGPASSESVLWARITLVERPGPSADPRATSRPGLGRKAAGPSRTGHPSCAAQRRRGPRQDGARRRRGAPPEALGALAGGPALGNGREEPPERGRISPVGPRTWVAGLARGPGSRAAWGGRGSSRAGRAGG